ncbi:MAG TPA: nucleoside triphosphate pyrophosphatase [Alphaproteobacteria bacterium]|nr:nucleoside triphosphate pyrophosphatase [Alphaproteobacteria bacterium]
MKLILASSSPRRRELLASIGLIPDQIISPDVDETPIKGEGIREYVKRIAILKARAVHSKIPEAYVLAADTSVEMGRRILLKAENKEEARQMLNWHSGRRHKVYSAVCVLSPNGREAYRVLITRISFKRLTTEEIEDYLASGEWEGKAGGYSIQGKAAKFVKFISGSYTNVVGLPLYETDCLLKGLGFHG